MTDTSPSTDQSSTLGGAPGMDPMKILDDMRTERHYLAGLWGIEDDDITLTVRLPDHTTMILGPTPEEVVARRDRDSEARS